MSVQSNSSHHFESSGAYLIIFVCGRPPRPEQDLCKVYAAGLSTSLVCAARFSWFARVIIINIC